MHPVPPPEMVVLSAYAPMKTNWHRWVTMELPVGLKRPANMRELPGESTAAFDTPNP